MRRDRLGIRVRERGGDKFGGRRVKLQLDCLWFDPFRPLIVAVCLNLMSLLRLYASRTPRSNESR